MTINERNALVEAHVRFARVVSVQIARRFGLSTYDDVISDGYLAHPSE
jgi:hypothetical protein